LKKDLLYHFLLVAVLLITACEEKPPLINSIEPSIGTWGETVTIRGVNFGTEQDDSFVTLAGASLTLSSYLEWNDTHISFTVPELSDSGLVFVYKDGKKSNPALFARTESIPQPAADGTLIIVPRVRSIEPSTGSIGSVVTITGSGFGTLRENDGVFFPWSTGKQEWIATSAGYLVWNDHEIQVQVPDGAATGNLEVRSVRGNSGPVFFEINNRIGTKSFIEKRSYTISYTVDIQVRTAQSPNTLYLWVPFPVTSAAQHHVELLFRTAEPFIENYRGSSLFRFNDLDTKHPATIVLSYLVDVYSVETTIKTQQIPLASTQPPVIPATALVPSGNQKIITQAGTIVGRERNPYFKAQKLYEWLIKTIAIQTTPAHKGALEALEDKQASAYSAALLFCALARAAGIQAVPVAGVLVDQSRSTTLHYWAEFWIDGLGWVPVDSALGAGAAPALFELRPDNATYYFGNLDNRRITFSHGETILSPMDPRGRRAMQTQEYALQNFWEEAIGALESYSSLWGNIQVTGTYSE
jgi:transglutaminase-like putative cysteine protease